MVSDVKLNLLSDLDADFAGTAKDISTLANALSSIPVSIPAGQRYRVERRNTTINVYGLDKGIDKYSIDISGSNAIITSVSHLNGDVNIGMNYEGIGSLCLNGSPYKGRNQS